MRQDYSEFVKRGAEVLVVGPDGPRAFQLTWAKQSFPFPGLADPQHRVANSYGQQVKLLQLGRMPALFVIDQAGRIRYHHYGESMSDIPLNAEVLQVLDRLNQEMQQNSS